MHFEGRVSHLVAGLQLLHDVRITGGGEEGRQPVVVLDDLVGDHASRDLAGRANHLWYPIGAFLVGVLLVAEGGLGVVGQSVHVRAAEAGSLQSPLGAASWVVSAFTVRQRATQQRSCWIRTGTSCKPNGNFAKALPLKASWLRRRQTFPDNRVH